jgi:hypothetical protein
MLDNDISLRYNGAHSKTTCHVSITASNKGPSSSDPEQLVRENLTISGTPSCTIASIENQSSLASTVAPIRATESLLTVVGNATIACREGNGNAKALAAKQSSSQRDFVAPRPIGGNVRSDRPFSKPARAKCQHDVAGTVGPGQSIRHAIDGVERHSSLKTSPLRARPMEAGTALPDAATAPARPFPTIQVAHVALRLHKLLLVVREAPGEIQVKDCWRRIEENVSAFRSDMLWLNDHAHFEAVAGSDPCGSVRGELDLTAALRSHSKNRSKNGMAGICHIKSRGGGSDEL